MATSFTLSGIEQEIFPLNLGGNTFGWTSDEETSFAVLDAFVAAGGNFIDTADAYASWAEGLSGGESETVIGNWMSQRDNRQDVVVATKVGMHPEFNNVRPDTIRRAAEASLTRLQVDHIDLYYAHEDDQVTPIADQVAAFDALVRDGLVRAVAVSNYSPQRMREFFTVARDTEATMPVAIQVQYNLLNRQTYETQYAPIANEFGAAVFPFFGLASGMLTGKYRSAEDIKGSSREAFLTGYANEDVFGLVDTLVEVAANVSAEPASVALAWLTAKGVTAPLASVSRPEQLPALLAATRVQLSDADVAQLDEASQPFA